MTYVTEAGMGGVFALVGSPYGPIVLNGVHSNGARSFLLSIEVP
jgi:hypothetical protein